jgi:hypothetical protein
MILISKISYDKYTSFIFKDRDTKRFYKIYDFSKTALIEPDKPYCLSGKVNSADKLYLVLEKVKEDKKNNC